MIDLHQLGYWLIAVVLFVIVPLLGTRPHWARRLAGRRFDRLGAWAWRQLTPVPEIDPLAEELYRVRRRERLRADVIRLQHILANDEWMSATRQLGNRIAYDWLVAELERTRSLTRTVFTEALGDSWSTSSAMTPLSGASWVPDTPGGSTVEVLDIGWRS